MTRHKHADLIIAWANGAKIQVKIPKDHFEDCFRDRLDWTGWMDTKQPEWNLNKEYRIKPEPKPDRVQYAMAFPGSTVMWTPHKGMSDNLKATFDGETGKLKKVEIIE